MTTTMTTLPAMPRASRKPRPTQPCACGCGAPTKGTWHPGHDGRATGWALRVERGVMTIDEVPANERKGCSIMMARHAAVAAKAKKTA